MNISDLIDILELAKIKYGNLPVKAWDDMSNNDPLIAYLPEFRGVGFDAAHIQINAGGYFGLERHNDAIKIKHPKNIQG